MAVTEAFRCTATVTAGLAAFPPPLTDADWLAQYGYRLDGGGYLADIRPSRQAAATAAAAAVRGKAAPAAAWLAAWLRGRGGSALSAEVRAAGAAEGYSVALLKKVRSKASVRFSLVPGSTSTVWQLEAGGG